MEKRILSYILECKK